MDKAKLLHELHRFSCESDDIDWDNLEWDEPISVEAEKQAQHLISIFPDDLPEPEMYVGPEADVFFGWQGKYGPDHNQITMSLDGCRIHYTDEYGDCWRNAFMVITDSISHSFFDVIRSLQLKTNTPRLRLPDLHDLITLARPKIPYCEIEGVIAGMIEDQKREVV